MTSSMYLFHNLDKTYYPEGKGKLRMISESEWVTWSDTEKNNFLKRNICYEIVGGDQREIQEIVGTFINGTLHGQAKLK